MSITSAADTKLHQRQTFDIFLDPETLQVRGRLRHDPSDVGLAGLKVEILCRPNGNGRDEKLIGTAMSGADGQFQVDLDRDEVTELPVVLCGSKNAPLAGCVFDVDQTVLAEFDLRLTSKPTEAFEVSLQDGVPPSEDTWYTLSTFLITSRRVRVRELAADLGSPAPDSPLQALSVKTRIAMLGQLAGIVNGHAPPVDPDDMPNLLGDERVINPIAVNDGQFEFGDIRVGDLAGPGIDPNIRFPAYPWALPDDRSYRDYLRSAFVLYAHQQAVGFSGNLTQWTGIIERQLNTRFFQVFETEDRTEVALNKLLIPIVTRILTAPTGSGFGFAVPPASIPAQGTLSDREYLDRLIALAPVSVEEFENRYRLPLRESDAVLSSPVRLNVYTLKRVLSDTAQGPVEPQENAITPQLPGNQGKPILWDTVVGAAPFFLRYEEWLDRQKQFFPENLYSLRTQIQACVRGEPWMSKEVEDFLIHHRDIPNAQPMGVYGGYFGSIGEVHNSAWFLLAFGAADKKLFELITAIDQKEYPKAQRLADEAAALLDKARAVPGPGENWEPSKGPANGFRPMSFAKRRNLAVTDIVKLMGNYGDDPAISLERFYEMPRPVDIWNDIYNFVVARDLATRLVRYQRAFLLPILKGFIHQAQGDYAAAINRFATVSGFYVGIAKLSMPPGAAFDKDHAEDLRSVYWERYEPTHSGSEIKRGDRPYTSRLSYADRSLQPSQPFVSQYTYWLPPPPPPDMKPTDLHPLEVSYIHILQAEAMLQWAEVLYRSDDSALLERARELYKGVLFLHGRDPGTSAYLPGRFGPLPIGFGPPSNPRIDNQINRARLGLFQLQSGLNFYGYREDAVPTLRYRPLLDAANRWSAGAKAAQNDFLAYMTRLEQMDLDLLAAQAQQKKAQAAVQISNEQIEIAKAGVAVANRLVADVQKQIDAKKKEIEDANSIFSQFKDYFKGMKEGVSSLTDVGKAADSGVSGIEGLDGGETKAALKDFGSGAEGWGGAGIAGAFVAFAVLSTITLEGMADAATKRDKDLRTLIDQTLPAAQAVVRVAERQVTIAQLQGSIAATDLDYANDLITYQTERFLNRDFWQSLAEVAGRVMHRELDLAAQAGWFAERALAYQLGRAIDIVRLDYFDPRLRDVTGVDRLMLDLVELEAVRLASARLMLPIKRTYSLARDLPLSFGALKQSGRCTFSLVDDDLRTAHPGTFGHRIKAVDVAVEAPGAVPSPRGMLSNKGLSYLRQTLTGALVPLVRYEDALPISEFRMRTDMSLHDMPGEQLMPFEGSGFTTDWTLEIPVAANPTGLARLTDVLITFDVQANFDGTPAPAAPNVPAPRAISRAFFASGLALDTPGFGTLRGGGGNANVRFHIEDLSIPGAHAAPKVTNVAVLLPGIDTGNFDATLRVGAANIPFKIQDGIAMSNAAHLSDGVAANVQPLNAVAGVNPVQDFEIEITKDGAGALLASARDVMLWVEYEHGA